MLKNVEAVLKQRLKIKYGVLGSILHELNLLEFFSHLEAPALMFGDGKQTAKWHFPNISAGVLFGKLRYRAEPKKIGFLGKRAAAMQTKYRPPPGSVMSLIVEH